MITINSLDEQIAKAIKTKNELKEAKHKSSGKLSASMLGMPLQWQVFKKIGLPQIEIDDYTLRKFERGNDVENWVVNQMHGLIETQYFVEYRNTVGYVDTVINSDVWNLNLGTLPHEIKSVSNAKFKRIEAQGPDLQHIYQACFYAIAMGKNNFLLTYIASDDYRIKTYLFEANEYSNTIDKIISDYDYAILNRLIPTFEAVLDWQKLDQYNPFSKYRDLEEQELIDALTEEYPDLILNYLQGKNA